MKIILQATGYIGKEKDAESNLGEHGVRKYDSDLGRFLCPDAMWEKYISYTPYQYCRNNPINAIDFNGLAEYYDNKGNQLGDDGVDNQDRYITTLAEFDKCNNSDEDIWGEIRSNKVPSKKTMEKIHEMISGISDIEKGIIQDKNGNPSNIIDGTKNPLTLDFSNELNNLYRNNLLPDILIHFHTKNGGSSISPEDKSTHRIVLEFGRENNDPLIRNSIMIGPTNFFNFYNESGTKTSVRYDIIKEISNK